MDSEGLASALVQSVLYGLVAPVNVVGGLVLGWFCRRSWHAIPAGLGLAALEVAYTLKAGLPEGAELAWWLLPVGAVAPVAWCGAGFALHRNMLREGSVGARFGWVVIGLLVGGVLGGVAGALLGSLYVEMAHVSHFEGEAGYVVVFLFLLPGILIGAILGAVIGRRRSRR